MQAGIAIVKVVCCKNLKGKPDVYVKIRCGSDGRKSKTKVRAKTSNPVWNEVLQISVSQGTQVLTVQVRTFRISKRLLYRRRKTTLSN